MKILHILYYYEPYTSGLTIYAARLAKALAARGHEVTILASRHDPTLPREETTPDGVHIRRLPVMATFDRAVIVPSLIPAAIPMMRAADVVHLHLPMAEAAPLVAIARLMRIPVVLTQHADLVLSGSGLGRLAATGAKWSAIGAARLANAVVANTESRARVSPVTRSIGERLHVIPPPIAIEPATAADGDDFRQDFNLSRSPIIGYVGRYASEKGLDVLLQTIPAVREQFPDATFALAGPCHDPRDGMELQGPWTRWLRRHASSIRQLDELSDRDLARFYAACDLLVLPSTDWTESFGMVQIEAMLHGTPVVASNLPGVCEPVSRTGYGLLANPGDVSDLATRIIAVLEAPERYRPDPSVVDRMYSLATTVAAYEQLYQDNAS